MTKIFEDDFTSRIMKGAKLEKHTEKVLKENKESGKRKFSLDELKATVRDVLKEELQKTPEELDAPPVPQAGDALPPAEGDMGGDLPPAGDEMGGDMPPAGDEMGGDAGDNSPLSAIRGAMEGMDWASVSDKDVEAIIQEIASAKWGEATDVSTEEDMGDEDVGSEALDAPPSGDDKMPV